MGHTHLPKPDASTTWESSWPTAIAQTVAPLQRGRADPTHRIVESAAHSGLPGVWRTSLTDDGPVSMLLTQDDVHTLTCRAWGPGARRAVENAPELCGAADDPSEFRPDHPMLEGLLRRNRGLRIGRTNRVLEALIPAILEQRVLGRQATTAWRRLVRRYGTPAPGPAPEGMKVFPAPSTWAAIPAWEWHRLGVDPRRTRTIIACVRRAGRLERLSGLPTEDAKRLLCTIDGIGVWTAAEIAQRAFGDTDALSVGDVHLARVVGHAMFNADFDDDAMVAALEPWRPHRYRVVRLLHAGGYATRPRFAPQRQ
ncbi:DNA-3-methyladenine glycosylase family protein [Thermocrispum municipale]|nr:DNA-3-methyladenine glycosylase 2 family protein [Thermocrispum municipale]